MISTALNGVTDWARSAHKGEPSAYDGPNLEDVDALLEAVSQMRSFSSDIADWLDRIVHDWHYYVGDTAPVDEFLACAESFGWVPPERDEFGDRVE